MEYRSNIIALLISELFHFSSLLHCLLQKGIGHLENKHIKLTIYQTCVFNLHTQLSILLSELLLYLLEINFKKFYFVLSNTSNYHICWISIALNMQI